MAPSDTRLKDRPGLDEWLFEKLNKSLNEQAYGCDAISGTLVLTEQEWREHGRANWLVHAKVENAVQALWAQALEKWGPPGS